MAVTLTASDRLAITRRQLKIPIENEGFQTSLNFFSTQSAALLQVDNANTEYYNFYNGICQSYESEVQQINGVVAATYLSSDIDAAAQNPSIAPFFPSTPVPAYSYNIPLISSGSFSNPGVNGYFTPSSTNILYEENLIAGLSTLITYYLSGPGSSSIATSTTIPAGVVTGLVLTVADPTGVNTGNVVSIANGTSYGTYVVTGTSTTIGNESITVNSVIPSIAAMAGGTISNSSSALQTNILKNITQWGTFLTTQVTALTANGDARSTQATQIATALTNANSAEAAVSAWISSPSYTSGGLSPITSEITTRTSYIPTRVTQVVAALGGTLSNSLSQTGNTFTATDITNSYYMRYQWINFRINRSSGSLRRYYALSQSSGQVGSLLSDNNSINAQYSSTFQTTAIKFNDGSNIVHVASITGFSNGDSVTVVSETQPELNFTILKLMGTTQIQLSGTVPTTYTIGDLARVFKSI